MADRKIRLSGVSTALALCVAFVPLPAVAQSARTLSAASLDPQEARAGAPEDYAWIDRADALWDAIGDSPPDTAFTFEDVEPWAWQTADGHTIIVEEVAEGMRSYYFEPRSEAPFLAVEPGASFGYEAGGLAMAYGPDGTALSELEGTARLEQAMVLFEHARQLKRAMRPDTLQPVDSGAWSESSLYLSGFLDLWQQGFLAQPAWRAQRESPAARGWRDRFASERQRRRTLGDGFRRWREGGFQGRPLARWQRPGETRPDQPPRQGIRPRPGRPEAGRPDRPWVPGTARPDRPAARPGVRPNPQVPALPPVVGTPRPDRPNRPDRPGRAGWSGTRPGGVVRTPPPATAPNRAQPGVVRPPRPWDGRPGWNRPRPEPQPGAAPLPTAPSGVRPVRPLRPEGRPGWNRRPPIMTPAPSAPSGVTPPVVRPVPARPDGRRDWRPRAPEVAPAAPPNRVTPPPAQSSTTPRPVSQRPVGARVPNQD